ncbi:hypothetical protein JVT61DRAFT_4555 [Boletus reticuloceps]|uniref:Uncharacterized protein n=1 Tax=Boletus reticuloceps TaxID=495285 RepID=A0A8I3A953_9AGAM|nr:hypothetical protein JVT61DRAFT_4555 [Boletus reticuloceps]
MIALRSEILKHPLEWTHMSRFASLYHPYKSWITPDHDFILCVLISKFPEPFLHAFLHRAPRKAKYSSNPLVHTVQLDKVDHARTLLLYGVDVNSVGWDIEDSEGLRRSLKLPLEAALQRENSVLLDLFLKEGSAMVSRKVYSTIFDGQHCDYPPQFVSSLLQADDFVEWAAEVHDTRLLRALNRDRYRQRQVTEEDLLVMIRRLVQIERSTSPLGSSEHILLIVALAASGGHLTLLEYLFSINAPMPSGIFFTEKTAPFVHNLALQGLNVRAVAAKGDTTLHQVLGRCTGDSRCWTERILTNVLTFSREVIAVVNAGATGRKIGDLEVPLVLSQLEKIVLASGALLQATHISFWDNSAIDYRSRRWLSGKEPKACLEILQHMVRLARVDMIEESVVNSEGSNHGDELAYPLPPQDKINDVVALFNEQQSHFRFLLALDLDEIDSPLRSRSEAVAIPDVAEDAQDTSGTRAATGPTSDRNERPQVSNEAQDIEIERSYRHQESIDEIDVIFVGQTGVGKSSLINMIRGIPDHSAAAAKSH